MPIFLHWFVQFVESRSVMLIGNVDGQRWLAMLTDGRKSSQDGSKDRRKFTYYYLKSTNHVLPMKNPKA